MSAPDQFVFMKVGMHAGENWESILSRKQEEHRRAGFSFWGYGGSTCHPLRQVRPFVKTVMEGGGRVSLLMHTMDSKADPDVVPATEYSEDGLIWKPIPEGIHVTGSRYAIVLGEIAEDEFQLPLHEYAVALGNSRGRPGSDYIQGRVDKACLERDDAVAGKYQRTMTVKITHKADILDPFAVLLR